VHATDGDGEDDGGTDLVKDPVLEFGAEHDEHEVERNDNSASSDDDRSDYKSGVVLDPGHPDDG
jgi:hypothetical protein